MFIFNQVLFHLEERQCVSQFHIIIDGLVDIFFNVISSDREREEVTYDLSPYISPEEMCNVRGVVYGSNDIGDSTSVELQAAGGKVNNYTLMPYYEYLIPTLQIAPPQ